MFTNKKPEPEVTDDRPKSKFDTLLTSTPVILTVLSTLLAGLSSSEMTQAQYHRALAAQNQSKAGDQWNFFQAKRIRGTNMDTTADVIAALAEPGGIDRARLDEFKSELAQGMKQAKEDSEKLAKMVDEAKSGLGSSSTSVVAAANKLKEAAERASAKAAENQSNLGTLLSEDKSVSAFESVGKRAVPKVQDKPVADADIQSALDAIRRRETEKQTAPLMRGITETSLHDEIEVAEENARRFDAACDPINDVLKVTGGAVLDQVQITRSFQRSAAQFNQALADAGVGDKKELEDIRKTSTSINRNAERMKTQAGQLYADFISSRHHFNALRYEREAKYNIAVASLYEVQVRKSSWNSERHRKRSGLFFFGMLAAQAGVTIATLALAVKLRSVLWGLASLAGFAAIVIAVVVYLYV